MSNGMEKNPMGSTIKMEAEARSAAKAEEKRLLDEVLSVAGDNEDRVHEGITKAIRGTNDKARRVYLRNLLEKGARDKIRRARKKYPIAA